MSSVEFHGRVMTRQEVIKAWGRYPTRDEDPELHATIDRVNADGRFGDRNMTFRYMPGCYLLDIEEDSDGRARVVGRNAIIARLWYPQQVGYLTAQSPGNLPNHATATVIRRDGSVTRRFGPDAPELTWPDLDSFLADPRGEEKRRKAASAASQGRIKFSVTLKDLADILGGDITGDWVRCPSPTHGAGDRSLAVKPSRRSPYGFIVHPHSASDSKEDCRKHVIEVLLAHGAGGEEVSEPPVLDEDDEDYTPPPDTGRDKLRYAQRLWDEADGGPRALGVRYLESRSIPRDVIKLVLREGGPLRVHPELRHPETGQYLPALIARIELPSADTMVAVHVTWLREDGSAKAEVAKGQQRRVYGHPAGGVVKLQTYTGGSLMLSEGIESGLADIALRQEVPKLMKATTWAAVSAGNLPSIKLPEPPPSEVHILSDGDKASRSAINKALARWGVHRVKVVEFGEGVDANDALRAKRRGKEASHD